MKCHSTKKAIAAALTLAASAHAQSIKGPSTASTPYAVPSSPLISTYSIFTTDNTGAVADDQVGGYGMAGTPDGLGAFDNGNGTFTVLMNHELTSGAGATHAHGSVGAFMSKWVIDKNTFAVISGSDLVGANQVFTWNSGTSAYNAGGTTAWTALCSADLAPVSAFSFGGLGTTTRIFMNGEEAGLEGRSFGTVVTGTNTGNSYELPRLGKFSWENAVASPTAQAKTVVIGMADTNSATSIHIYVGNKTGAGTEVERAGLTNGVLYGLRVDGGAPRTEDRTTELGIGSGTKPFSLQFAPNGGNVENLTGTATEAGFTTANATIFQRTEDGAWDTKSNNTYYFVTTDQYDQVKDGVGATVGRSRLWKLAFSDIANPENGGNISLLLDGTEAGNMWDNIAVDLDGNILLLEDVGAQAHNGKLYRYNVASNTLDLLAKHDPARNGDIGTAATAPFNNNEEFSGVIDLTSIMAGSALNAGAAGERWYLMDDQQHYTSGITTAQVEGGQLIAVHVVPEPGVGVSILSGLGVVLGWRRLRRFSAPRR